MPDRGAAHAEASNDDATVVNAIGALDRIERFKQIYFTGQLVGIAVAAIEMQDDRVLRCELTRVALSLAEERQVKPGLLINASRVLLTGKAVAPGIFEVMVMLGQTRTVQRLRRPF